MSYHLMACEELHTLPDTDVLEHFDSQIDALDEVLAPDNSAATVLTMPCWVMCSMTWQDDVVDAQPLFGIDKRSDASSVDSGDSRNMAFDGAPPATAASREAALREATMAQLHARKRPTHTPRWRKWWRQKLSKWRSTGKTSSAKHIQRCLECCLFECIGSPLSTLYWPWVTPRGTRRSTLAQSRQARRATPAVLDFQSTEDGEAVAALHGRQWQPCTPAASCTATGAVTYRRWRSRN